MKTEWQRVLEAGCVLQNRVECGVIDRAGEGLGAAVGANDDERWLRRYLEAEIHVARIVTDRGERQLVLVDELLKVGVVARPCDTDELHGPCPALACRFDRSGFTVADASSGRPEPQHDRFPRHRRPIEFSAPDERGPKVQSFGNPDVGRTDGGY